MITLVSMAVLLAFLGFVVLFTDVRAKDTRFFDKDVTNCLRGFWCIIILLVHVPTDYQNFIQDTLGSFAYVGVTFFFLTSGYGLALGVKKTPEQIRKSFWKRRLPKLLVPMILVNIVRVLIKLYAYEEFLPLELFGITGFVRQLLLFYFLFWGIFRFFPKQISMDVRCNVLCCCVFAFSVLVYYWDENPVFGWPVESLGFAYGVLLARNKEKFVVFVQTKWFLKSFAACCLALMLGVTYLLFKDVVLIGDYIVKIALAVAILLFMLLLTARLKIGNPISRFLGEISYEVYLIHDVVFIVLSVVYAKMNSGIFVILSILFTVILSVLINKASKAIVSWGSKRISRVKLWQKN